jgi:hypothetical protein
MGLRFHRRLNVGPIRLNFSRTGVGLSVGVPGFRVGTRPNGRRYTRVSLPGTGLGYHMESPASPSAPARGPTGTPGGTPPRGAGCAIVILTVGTGLAAIVFA